MIQITAALLLALGLLSASLSASPGEDDARYVPLPQKRAPITAEDLDRVVPPSAAIPPRNLLSIGPKCRLYNYRGDLDQVYEMSVKVNPTTGNDDVKAYITTNRGESKKGILLRDQTLADDCHRELLNALKGEAWTNYMIYSEPHIGNVQERLTPRVHAQLDKEYKHVWTQVQTSDRIQSYSVTGTSLTASIMIGYMEKVFNKTSLQKPLTLNLGYDFTIQSIESNMWSQYSSDVQTSTQLLRGYYPQKPASGIADPSEDAPLHHLVDTFCKQTFVEYLVGFLQSQGKDVGVYREDDIKGARGYFTIEKGSQAAKTLTEMGSFIKAHVAAAFALSGGYVLALHSSSSTKGRSGSPVPPPKPSLPRGFRLARTTAGEGGSPPAAPTRAGFRVDGGASDEVSRKLEARRKVFEGAQQPEAEIDEAPELPIKKKTPSVFNNPALDVAKPPLPEKKSRASLPKKRANRPDTLDLKSVIAEPEPQPEANGPLQPSSEPVPSPLVMPPRSPSPGAGRSGRPPLPAPRPDRTPPTPRSPKDFPPPPPRSPPPQRSPSKERSRSPSPQPSGGQVSPPPPPPPRSPPPQRSPSKERSRSPSPQSPGERSSRPPPPPPRRSSSSSQEGHPQFPMSIRKDVSHYENMLQADISQCRVFTAFTTHNGKTDVMYEMAMSEDGAKIYYKFKEGGKDMNIRKAIIKPDVLVQFGMPEALLSKDNPKENCTRNIEELLLYVWNHISSDHLDTAAFEDEIAEQLRLDAEHWESFATPSTFHLPSSLAGDILLQAAADILAGSNRPQIAILPRDQDDTWYFNLAGTEYSLELKRDFTPRTIRLPNEPEEWGGMWNAIGELESFKEGPAGDLPASSAGIAKAAFIGYLSGFCHIVQRSKEDKNGQITYNLGKYVYDRCNSEVMRTKPLWSKITDEKEMYSIGEATFEIASGKDKPLAMAFEDLMKYLQKD
ncbi:hypothetical protein FOL47_001494 [Perkinsus chesapeaki]|uniref:Uncharacterized protein n=1 Tax=Perkinsus chesapeaki TaxID=330153 RepID=A0A7J6MKJ3_PERCH|nr:hypothetical protein FOL47_001494 [Perkinsus chesapeaki]